MNKRILICKNCKHSIVEPKLLYGNKGIYCCQKCKTYNEFMRKVAE